jgi:hypothetical protein
MYPSWRSSEPSALDAMNSRTLISLLSFSIRSVTEVRSPCCASCSARLLIASSPERTSARCERVTVHREYYFIDVVLEITTAQDAAVIVIENKIDAGEQPQQIARYQETGP